jgi:hypothetical protein
VTHLLRAPDDWMAAYRAQAEEDGLELSEWIRRQCNGGLSKKRRKGLSEPIQRGRPKKQEGADGGS